MRNSKSVEHFALSLALFLTTTPRSTPRPTGKFPPNRLEKTRKSALYTKHGPVIHKRVKNGN